MRIARYMVFFPLILLFALPVLAETPSASSQEQALSATLDLWREGRYEQLFDQLSRRGRSSREQFVKRMRDTTIRPACCWRKLENFRVLSQKKGAATVYATVGLEGAPGHDASSTREFTLLHEEGDWKMQLNDLYALAGVSGKQKRSSHKSSVVRP